MQFQLVRYGQVPLDQAIKEHVKKIHGKENISFAELSEINLKLGQAFAGAVHDFARQQNLQQGDIDVIGSKGHTLWPASPPPFLERSSAISSGEGTFMASTTGITTVTDLSLIDPIPGRQAPLLEAFLEALALRHPESFRACLIIESSARVCFIPPDSEGGIKAVSEHVLGPVNALIDASVNHP